MRKKITVLGSTGSIGIQALEVIEALGWEISGLAASSSVETLEAQIRKFRPPLAAMADEAAAADLRVRAADLPTKILSGPEGIRALAADPAPDIVLNAVVGMVGLPPTLAAAEAGHDIALANKESLVAGGALVTEAVRRRGVKLLPVDSEHSAIFQCLQGQSQNAVKKLILTASGGPFFGKTIEEMAAVAPEQALRHPTWRMGAKITVDSATMMNKGLELTEACWLFGLPPERVEVVIHRESIIHSLVEFADSAALAQLGLPDMRVPIQYALTYPERCPSPAQPLDLAKIGKLTFFPPDDENFPALRLWRQAIEKGGLYPAALNAANEAAVALFLAGKIRFVDIAERVARQLERRLPTGMYILEDVMGLYEEIVGAL